MPHQTLTFEVPSHTDRGFCQRLLFVRPTTKLAQYIFFKICLSMSDDVSAVLKNDNILSNALLHF